MTRLKLLLLLLFVLSNGVYAQTCQDLLKAIDKGDEAETIRLISSIKEYECKDEDGFTPLQLVIKRSIFNQGQTINIVKLLVENGARVNVRKTKSLVKYETTGVTPLMAAAAMGMDDVVTILLDHGADINAKDDNGETAVMYAALMSDGNPTTVKLLTERGCDLNLRTRDGYTILINSMRSSGEKYDVIKMFLDKGLDVNEKSRNGSTALIYSALYGNFKTVRMLIERGAKINEKNEKGRDALMMASGCVHPNIELVKLLLENGADVQARDEDGRTAYFNALDAGNIEIAKLLADAGADTKPRNRLCKQILKKAIKNGWTEAAAR